MLPQQTSLLGLYGPVLLHLLGNTGNNIAPAARPIRIINSSNIALPGRTIVEEILLLEIEMVCIMNQVGIYSEI